jgi:hypothetical protein
LVNADGRNQNKKNIEKTVGLSNDTSLDDNGHDMGSNGKGSVGGDYASVSVRSQGEDDDLELDKNMEIDLQK